LTRQQAQKLNVDVPVPKYLHSTVEKEVKKQIQKKGNPDS